MRRGLRSGSQITETRTLGFAVEIGGPGAETRRGSVLRGVGVRGLAPNL